MKQKAEENSLGCGTELCCLHSCTGLFAGSLEQQNRNSELWKQLKLWYRE